MNKIFQGDCLKELKKLKANSVDLILTDPPYGTTACAWDIPVPFHQMWEQLLRVAKTDAAIVFTASQPFTSALLMSRPALYRHCYVWTKNIASGHLSAKKRPMRKHEDVLVFSKRPARYFPVMNKGKLKPSRVGVPESARTDNGVHTGSNASKTNLSIVYNDLYYPNTILSFSLVARTESVHPTQKPVELMEYLIETYTRPGDVVLDPFMGSGTTIVAALKTDRQYIGIELSRDYIKLAKERLRAVQLPLAA